MLSAPQLGRAPFAAAARCGARDARAAGAMATPWEDEIGVSPSLSPKLPPVSVPYGCLVPRSGRRPAGGGAARVVRRDQPLVPARDPAMLADRPGGRRRGGAGCGGTGVAPRGGAGLGRCRRSCCGRACFYGPGRWWGKATALRWSALLLTCSCPPPTTRTFRRQHYSNRAARPGSCCASAWSRSVHVQLPGRAAIYRRELTGRTATYVAAISRVALIGSFNTLQSALKFASRGLT